MSLWQRLARWFARRVAADAIKHVIVLMFENHSFDQMLGDLRAIHPQLEGVDPQNPHANLDSTGRQYLQRPSNDTIVDPDPMHELGHVLNQLAGGNAGFVSEYEKEYPQTTADQRQRIMDYFELGTLPALHELARHFTICDHWYSSVPGPTWTNRFFVHSATSKGLVTMPDHLTQTSYYLHYDQDTIFDRLDERGIAWRIYYGDVPLSLVLSHQRRPKNARHYHWLSRFFSDVAGPEHSFPGYVFLEPNYFHLPLEQPQNDDHPPHSAVAAQALLAKVYNAIRANQALWTSTLFVVLYDEHGGFYDHVSPPAAVPPGDGHTEEYTFDRLGVRVPAVLVSPWVDRGVLSTQFDHTSLLRYLIDKWQLRSLTDRDRNANSFADAIRTSGLPRTDTPETIDVTPPPVSASEIPLNENQQALLHFTEHLEANTAAAPATVAAAVAPSHGHLAKRRVDAFLAQQKATPQP